MERAVEIESLLFDMIHSLTRMPNRGTIEQRIEDDFFPVRYILFRESHFFEIKILYQVIENESSVSITDFFPTAMHPNRLSKDK